MFFADLDGTTVYSARRLADRTPVVPVEHKDGRAIGFVAADALPLLAAIQPVYTTARTLEQFRRLRIPGAGVGFDIVNAGATILVDGQVDGEWDARMRALADAALPQDALADVQPLSSRSEWLAWTADPVDDRVSRTAGWRAHRTNSGHLLLPRGIGKEVAVREVMRRVGGGRIIAAGDEAMDAGMLDAADVALQPAHGTHLTAERMTRPGPAGGLELLRWVSAVQLLFG
jgi:hypothetical protein